MRILLADDHRLFREAMIQVLETTLDAPLVLEAADCDETLRMAEHHSGISLVLLDLFMPGVGGLAMIPKLRRLLPDCPIVIVSSSTEPEDVHSALNMGAVGYIPKTAGLRELGLAIRLIMDGETYVPMEFVDAVDSGADETDGTVVAQPAAAPPPSLKDLGLTPRQQEVLVLLTGGTPNKIIAHELGVSESTVKLHVYAILRALGVRNRTEAALKARESLPAE